MTRRILHVAMLMLSLGLLPALQAQFAWVDSLYTKATEFNRQGNFSAAIQVYNLALSSDTLSPESRYWLYLYKSMTYKWLGDYPAVERNLELAKQAARKSRNAPGLEPNINLNLALLHFDNRAYGKADTLMKLLRKSGFNTLDSYDQALIVMQEGYLLFLKGKYPESLKKYSQSIAMMKKGGNECDIPIIKWKELATWLAMKKPEQAELAIEEGLNWAKWCNVEKFQLYMFGEAATHYAKNGFFEKAYYYSTKRDSISEKIDAAAHQSQIAELEKEFQREHEYERQALNKKTLEAQSNFNYLMTAVIIGLVVVGCLLVLLLRLKRTRQFLNLRKKYAEQLIQNVENDRKRIANELHDGINHDLLSLKLELQEKTKQRLVDGIIHDVRNLSRNLHPTSFDLLELNQNIEMLITRLQQNTPIILTCELDELPELTKKQGLHIYRIIQESITNIIKHSGAVAAKVSIVATDKEGQLTIRDNGSGFKVDEVYIKGQSFGLMSIRERTEILEGSFSIESSDKGTSLHIRWPRRPVAKTGESTSARLSRTAAM